MRVLIAVALCGLSWNGAHAGPFGLEKGQRKEALSLENPGDASGSFVLRSVPKPHPDFVVYQVQFSKKTGLCIVSAASAPYAHDPYGENVGRDFLKIERQLNDVYGASIPHNYLKPGAMFVEPRHWTMSIFQNERVFGTRWSKKTGAHLKDNIEEINLKIKTIAFDQSYIGIHYYFNNSRACQAENDSNGQDSL